MPSIASVTLVVREYDEAIAFFTQALGFQLLEDSDMGGGKRWVVVAPPGQRGATLLLAKAKNDAERAAIGNQTGGRVAFFLHTDDFQRDYDHMMAHGVQFTEEPRAESYGKVVVFLDLYGNKWDMIERKA
jgi:catechol 2,3-dioxygenase-like lactoylglutathione lyase family enzyme